jgi:hypothetical protein
MSAKDVQFLFLLRNQVKLYHWQTMSYARHKATDMAVDSLDENIDKYVEVYMGRYGRPKMTASTEAIQLKNLSETQIVKFIKGSINYLQTKFVSQLKPVDTDLFNLRDEMLGDLNQLLYLFSLQ